MKKRNLFNILLIMVLVCAFSFGFNNTVKATTTLDKLNDDLQGITKTTNDDGSYTLKLNSTTSINLEIKSGEKVTLDLNGKTLANDSSEGMPTILVDQGAELTIMDSSEGNAYIHRSNVVPNFEGSQPVIRNNGTLTITGGTILTSEQSCYGIENSGKLTISGGGVTVSTETTYGIFNKPNAEVNITDGRFQQGTIPGHSANAPLVVNQGKLNITGGTFLNNTGDKVPSIADITGGTASVTGGQFVYQDPDSGAQENQDMSNLMPEGFELDKNGNVVKKSANKPTTSTEPEKQQSPKKDSTPKTGEVDYSIYVAIAAAVVALSGIYTVKKLVK